MAFKTRNVTMTGSKISAAASLHIPVKQVLIYNDSGNSGSVNVGDTNITATVFGFTVPKASATETGLRTIGPFPGELPFNLEEVFLIGTNNDIIRISYVT